MPHKFHLYLIFIIYWSFIKKKTKKIVCYFFIKIKILLAASSRGGLVVERLLHKKFHSALVDRIPSKYGVLIIQKWKHFVAIQTAECRAFGFIRDRSLGAPTCHRQEGLFTFRGHIGNL